MMFNTKMTPVASAVAMAISAVAVSMAPGVASAGKTAGTYVTGDFHNHTTCSDGSISMQMLVKKSTDKVDTPWGLDWFVQAGHGGNGNRNCSLVEDESVATPAYPVVEGKGPTTTWANSIGAAAVKGNASNGTPLSSQSNPSMWRWQSIQEISYPIAEYLTALKGVPVFMGMESVVSGHEHTSMSVITGQLPAEIDHAGLPTGPGYTPLGNAAALAQWSYCFDRNDSDNSRGAGQSWDCSVPGSLNAADANWNATAAKLTNNSGEAGHLKTVEGVKWMAKYHPNASYYVPAHLERAGPFNPSGSNGFNIEHLRNFNNAAPRVAFGFESQPGHGASSDRGEYYPDRNNFGGKRWDSVGGTTWGGTGVYAAQIGGVWDALLGEGRNWWFFASSDWHNRGSFGTHDVRSTQDFYPGEYQRDFVMVRNGSDKVRPQAIVDGLRSGNSFASSGQLIDRLGFVACASYKGLAARTNASVERLALNAAMANTDTDVAGCATMGEKLSVRPGAEIVVAIVVRDPSGTNYSPYSFPNPSLAQVGITQPMNAPELDHVDVIRGMVTGYKQPASADYAGAWPDDWVENADMARVPAAAKNTTAAVIKTFNDGTWASVAGNPEYKSMVFRIPAVAASQYIRLRGSNLPAGVPYETDDKGNPLADVYTNAGSNNRAIAPLSIPCKASGSNVPGNDVTHTASMTKIDGCPNHLPVVNGQKMVAYDVAAWADLWFYSNPIFIEVANSTQVAGVK
ncbi:hypothetical protein [Methyloversatilis thermotolerans]|uniref:hypothetical protein n=1 Tax=Methyloversatilis thermotolerans TaxID=1346290 RepID=UPI00037ABA3D|nr:hypothetical protein [Methyloversatilis thermotolerans]